ncbi:MAG: pyrroline-5-carboxylate reductase [Deltaproteobacteria bacterium]|nr:pyrroline-5-carboxylate reductase [Deltaproteobacteria bacterium]
MLADKTIGVLGAGNMGEALIAGLVKASLVRPEQILASRRSEVALAWLRDQYGVRTTLDNRELVAASDLVVLAVKPQVMPSVLEETADRFRTGQVVISIAAGITTAMLESYVRNDIPVVRVMPNTPALVGEAVSPYCLGRHGSTDQALLASQIFSAVGMTVQIDEDLMDAVTALSGTGPAYLFYLLEGLIDAGVAMGLPEYVSRALVRQTAYGAAKLVVETPRSPRQLRAQVTSPQGTTHAAMTHLDREEFLATLRDAVFKARDRARELGLANKARGEDAPGG